MVYCDKIKARFDGCGLWLLQIIAARTRENMINAGLFDTKDIVPAEIEEYFTSRELGESPVTLGDMNDIIAL